MMIMMMMSEYMLSLARTYIRIFLQTYAYFRGLLLRKGETKEEWVEMSVLW